MANQRQDRGFCSLIGSGLSASKAESQLVTTAHEALQQAETIDVASLRRVVVEGAANLNSHGD